MKTLPRNTILRGDARKVLAGLLTGSVDCVVTSPPYANGLRRYSDSPGELGQEPNVTEYVANLVAVLRQVRRLLKDSGALWLNLGDSFSKHARQGAPRGSLLLVPQRLALALAADGWILRNVCAWAKPNSLPSSAKDRLSPTYETVIFATKSRRYFFDLDAIRVPHRSADRSGVLRPAERCRRYQGGNSGLGKLKAEGRVGHRRGKNPGDLWTIPTAADRSGHQATFPAKLIEPMILATCPEKICVQCDSAWRRPTGIRSRKTSEGMRHTREVGKLRRCDCFAPSRPGVVLDPFCGLNTTGLVAERLRRDWLGVELNPTFIKLADDRLRSARRAMSRWTASRRAGGSLSCPPQEPSTTKGGLG